ncbi:hypothetical protein [Oligosphaera ethanolica]|uniref:Uncharacterized protein n=1 Tax=Oligosphaera ethanolica TaxID=760260 RepID=A0AAE4AMG8_9BACT|nr:hypothetical protein [Oligosphaera ethanolica]MDQ0288476.1 hypothetical protein [Oligosphaera ethanolica]
MPMMSFFGWRKDDEYVDKDKDKNIFLPEEQRENLEHDIAILDDEDGAHEQRLMKVAEREVQSAAEDSLKKLQVVKMGRCPVCGEHLSQHLSANICEACGWHKYDIPKQGGIKVHLRNNEGLVEGERAYVLNNGDCLVISKDVVTAKIPASAYAWVEYAWTDDEVSQRSKAVTEMLQISCGWCGGKCDTKKDGFHLVHVAFGTTQERYCFCSDDCYEAFRKMYPARVHRNCYDRNCADCNLCTKRYGDEAEGMRVLAKDLLRAPSLTKKKE